MALIAARISTIQFASTAESLAGTIANKAVNPVGLKAAVDDLETRAPWSGQGGTVDFATIAEHLAGTIANKAATPAGVKAVVNALIASAPGALNTLNELAAALGDDANFAATVNTALGNRVRTNGSTAFTGVQRGVTPPNNPNSKDLVTVDWAEANVAIAPRSLSPNFDVSNVDVTRNLSRVITNYNWVDIIFQESVFGGQSIRSRVRIWLFKQ